MRQPPVSLWWDDRGNDVERRAPLAGDVDVDVAIVGAGFTGLWTARELLRRDPSLRVVILERDVAGFGASGRNGGWASALYPQSAPSLRARVGVERAEALEHELRRAVPALGAALEADGVDAHFVHGGTLTLARNEAQRDRLQGQLGFDDQWLSADEARERCGASSVLGAVFNPHSARLHPARAVRGLARAVENRGVTIYEDTPVTRLEARSGNRPARAVTPCGVVRATWVVRATEGFSGAFAGARRTMVPLYSLMIATEPQPASFWQAVGLRGYETFADDRHLIIYGQRTNDDRLAFGGRGAPYHFGSSVSEHFDDAARVFNHLERTLRDFFPDFDGRVSHRWGGALAMPRDHSPSVVADTVTGLASAGGYTGDGVVLSRLCGETLADLLATPGAVTPRTTLPFVAHRARRWEPEPFRWLGINAGLALAKRADYREARGATSRATSLLDRLLG